MTEFIPEEKIKEIRERASILEVIADFVSLKKSGKNYLGLCPFHSERTPSFTVNEEKGIFHCFGCGAGGNIFNFLMRVNNFGFPEAVKELAKRYGITLPRRELSAAEKARRTLKERLFEVNDLAATYYQGTLISLKEGEEGRRYLAQRGISKEITETYRLGFAPASWDSLALFLQHKGVPLNLAQSLGLILPRQEGKGLAEKGSFYDRFRRRVIFPIFNVGGKVCGFGGRIIDESELNGSQPSPKYINSPESPVYNKGQNLYGLNVAIGAVREKGKALVVEGYMDLLSLYREGIRNVVASLGTALTPAQVSLLGRYTREAVVIFDADEGGQKATQRSLELFLQEGIAAQIASLPSGFDPDSFIRREKRAGFEQVLAKALPLMDFLLEQALARYPASTVEGKVRAVRELIPALKRLPDPLERNLYVERIASRLGIKEAEIRSQLRRKEAGAKEEETISPREHGPAHEKLLLQLMLFNSQVIPQVEEVVGKDGFADFRYQKLAREIWHFWKRKKEVDPQDFLNQVEDEELKDLVAELLLTGESLMDPDRILRDCLRKVKLSRLKQEMHQVDDEIRQRIQKGKEDSSGASGLKELLKRKQRLLGEQKKWLDEATNRLPA